MTDRRVHELAIAVLKGGRLTHPKAVDVGSRGIADDRRFFVIAENGRQLDARRGALTAVAPIWDGETRPRCPSTSASRCASSNGSTTSPPWTSLP